MADAGRHGEFAQERLEGRSKLILRRAGRGRIAELWLQGGAIS
jgi:hypothetical protein